MLLALDVGNTNIVIGFLDESGIRNIARLETDRDKTAHEYAISLRQVIEFSGIAPEDIDGAILSSVVPPINGALIAAVRMITGIRPLVVGPGMKTGLNIALDNPAAMGSDLVVGAAAALAIHVPPLIIIDMGTARASHSRRSQTARRSCRTSRSTHRKNASAPTRSRPCAPAVSTARPPCSTA